MLIYLVKFSFTKKILFCTDILLMGNPFAQKTGVLSFGDDQKEGTDVNHVTKYFAGHNCAVGLSISDAGSTKTCKEMMLYELLEMLALLLHSFIHSITPAKSHTG